MRVAACGLPVAVLAALLGSRAAVAEDDDAARVAAFLVGTFDSHDQATTEPGFADIRIVGAFVPRSRLGFGAAVVYVEHAAAATLNSPYRQRFLRIESAAAGKVLVRVFEPRDRIAASGKWRDPEDLAVFGVSDMLERPGCLITLRRMEGREVRFEGGNDGTGCPAVGQGARYATLSMSLTADRLELWDRGFDADGRQVWGPTRTPHRFVRRSPSAPQNETLATPTRTPTPAPPPDHAVPPDPTSGPSKAPSSTATPTSAPTRISGTVSGRDAAKESPRFETAVPEDTAALPAVLQASTLVVRGAGPRTSFAVSDLRALPSVEGGRKGTKRPAFRGVPLREVLRATGLKLEGGAARRLLAAAVVLVETRDQAFAVFSVDELLARRPGPVLVLEREGRPVEGDSGFEIEDPESPSRSLVNVIGLEFRLLAKNPVADPTNGDPKNRESLAKPAKSQAE